MYPEYVEIDGNKYKINTDYRVALSCFEAINDISISDMERTIAIIVLLLGKNFPIEYADKVLDKLYKYLRCGKEQNQEDSEIDMDYEQDKRYIASSFMSRYHIDIDKEKMHWWLYNDLIEGFGEDDILSRVRYIRNLDINDFKDKKDRDKILKAKSQVKLKERKTKEEIELDKWWNEELGGENNE